MNKRVYYIGNFIIPDGNAAGKRVYANAELLQKLGYEIIFIGFSKNVNIVQDSSKFSFFQGKKSYEFASHKNYFSWINFVKSFNFAKEIIERNRLDTYKDIIIYYGSPSIAIFINKLRKYAKFNNIPFISDCVDWLTTKTQNIWFNVIRNLDNFYLKGIINKKSDGIIVISEFLYDYYKKSVRNIVKIPPLSSELKRFSALQNENQGLRLIYAGQLFRKNQKSVNPKTLKDRIDIVFDAMVLLKKSNVKFVFNIFGFLKEECIIALPFQKDNIEYLSDRVYFHGIVPNSVVQNEIHQADFMILIRDFNRDSNAGFPTKVSESISCGTPVITTMTSDIAEYLIEDEHVFFVRPDKFSLFDKLIKLSLFDIETLIQLKKQCISSQTFYIDNYLDRFERFLNNIIEEE